MTYARREPARERIEIETIAKKAPGPELREPWVSLRDLAGQQLRELRLAQKYPVTTIGSDQDVSRDPSPAKETQPVDRDRRRRRHDARGHDSSSGATARCKRTIVSCKAKLQNEFSIA